MNGWRIDRTQISVYKMGYIIPVSKREIAEVAKIKRKTNDEKGTRRAQK